MTTVTGRLVALVAAAGVCLAGLWAIGILATPVPGLVILL